ncbi:cytosine-purine permease [Cantharellus anzutake]|uniref:cytosine-purine permease n=1 Tax=Cantharellus anzutake TaxID=1750568 RepID=UPI001904E712|nr:cytosine-purine permease [Cantharellus anzutake]KAF8334189.1 cytosine-purine permease [Cantharellus anzutake]
MDPTPPHERVWTMLSFISLWVSDAFNTATWELASASIAIGLGWKQALPAVALGHFLIALVITANGTIGARLHVPFPVLNRSSFGFWFSYFTVISRVVLAMFWFAIQTFTGSECVYQMIKAIWPSFAHWPNRLPASANITSAGLLSYFIFWLIQFPFLLVSPQKVRWLFTVKAALVPVTFIAMMAWAFSRTGGGPLFDQRSRLHGSALSWAWLGALNSALGNYATLAVNIPDFTRYARKPSDQYVQVVIIPILFTFAAFIGIVVTSAGNVLYGSYIWDPLRLIDRWDNRAAAFFASFSFALATLGTNISANSISAANDFTALAPKYINIRRGQIICAIIGGWALCPWKILAHAIGFLTFMAGYTVVLAPICAVMVTDYWAVKKRHVDIPSLYRPDGRYAYWNGLNWRAALALLCTVPLGLPGLISTINPAINVGSGGNHLFSISYIMEFVVAGAVYYCVSALFPARESMVSQTIYSIEEASSPGEHEDDEQKVSGV